MLIVVCRAMSTLTKMTRRANNLESPRPLKLSTSSAHNRNSVVDVKISSSKNPTRILLHSFPPPLIIILNYFFHFSYRFDRSYWKGGISNNARQLWSHLAQQCHHHVLKSEAARCTMWEYIQRFSGQVNFTDISFEFLVLKDVRLEICKINCLLDKVGKCSEIVLYCSVNSTTTLLQIKIKNIK